MKDMTPQTEYEVSLVDIRVRQKASQAKFNQQTTDHEEMERKHVEFVGRCKSAVKMEPPVKKVKAEVQNVIQKSVFHNTSLATPVSEKANNSISSSGSTKSS